MVCTLLPATALAADVTVSDETALADAIENAADGDTITLGTDIMVTTPITIDHKITLDGNGKTIFAGFSLDYQGGALRLDEGSAGTTIQNVTFALSMQGRDDAGIYFYGAFNGANATTTIQNCKFRGTGASGDQSIGILSAAGPVVQNIQVIGCEFSKLKYGMYMNSAAELTVSESTFTDTTWNAINIPRATNVTIVDNTMTNIVTASPEQIAAFGPAYASAVSIGNEDPASTAVVKNNSIQVNEGAEKLYIPENATGLHKVVFDTQGGSAVEPQLVADKTPAAKPANPTRTGYTFVKWVTDLSRPNHGAGVGKNNVTADTTYYAVWDANSYTITLDPQVGSLGDNSAEMTVDYDGTYDLPTLEDTATFRFTGWCLRDGTPVKSGDTVAITQNETLYATWESNLTVTDIPAGLEITGGSDKVGTIVDGKEKNASLVFEYRTEDLVNKAEDILAQAKTDLALSKDADILGLVGIQVYVNENGILTKVDNAVLSEPVTISVPFADITMEQAYSMYHYNGTGFDGPLAATAKTVNSQSFLNLRTNAFSPFVVVGGVAYNTITVANDAGCNVVYKSSAKTGEDYTFTVSTEPGYDIVSVKANGNSFAVGDLKFVDNQDGSYTIVAVDDNYNIEIKTAKAADTRNLVYKDAKSDGAADATAVEIGHTVTVNAAPAEVAGMHFGGWRSSDGGTVYQPGDTFKMPDVDVTLTAQWEQQYTLTYDVDGGDEAAPAAKSGTKLIVADYEGTKTVGGVVYTFVGWNTNLGGNGTTYLPGSTIELLDNITLYAQWEDQNEYEVVFKQGTKPSGATADITGTKPTMVAQKYGEVITLPENTLSIADEADGTTYVMTGWKYDTVVYAPGSTFVMPQSKVVFTAQWKKVAPDKSTVVYNANGGVNPPVDYATYKAGSSYTLLDAGMMTRDGYTFTGWFADQKCTGTALDTATLKAGANVFYAGWEAVQTYGVSYNPNGADGTAPVDANTYAEKDVFTVLPADLLTKAADETGYYVFGGWNTKADGSGTTYAPGSSAVMGAENITLYAVWNHVDFDKYTVIYNLNGGTSATPIVDNQAYIADATVTVTAEVPTKEGYHFNGWRYMTANGPLYQAGDSFQMPGETVYLVADWTKTYTVTYNAAGGSTAPVDPTAYDLDQTVTVLDAVTREHYAFKGWLNNQDGKIYAAGESFKMPAANVILTAQWEQLFTLTYDANGASGSVASVVDKTADEEITIADSTGLVKAGSSFIGWNTQADGSGDTYYPGNKIKLKDNMTLYAQWGSEYTIVFDDNLDAPLSDYVTINDTHDAAYTGQVTLTDLKNGDSIKNKLPRFARVNYIFNGWVDSNGDKVNLSAPLSNLETLDAQDGTVDQIVTIYASWSGKYTAPTAVEIETSALKTGIYANYYSDFIRAFDTTPAENAVYRNFVLVGSNGKTANATKLPEGLYLNSRTGEVYGVPTLAGEYEFYVRMRDDESEHWISEAKKITITIQKADLHIDHKAGDNVTYQKTYGDKESKAKALDGTNEGLTYGNKTNLDVVIPTAEITLSDSDNNVVASYDYTAKNTERETNAASFNAASANTLQYAPDLDATHQVPNTKTDNMTAHFQRIAGEDADSYKLYMLDADVSFVEPTLAENHNLLIAEAFKTQDKTESTAAQYLFTIRKAEFNLDMSGDSSVIAENQKIYGEDNTILPSSRLADATITNAAELTAIAKAADTQNITITMANGIQDIITIGYKRVTGEDAGTYKLYLIEDDIVAVQINGLTDDADALANKMAKNYVIHVNADFGRTDKNTAEAAKYLFTIHQKPGVTYEKTVTYGEVKPGEVLQDGTWTNIVATSNVGIQDTATATVRADAAASGAGFLKASTYTNANNILDFAVNNTADPLGTASANTTANYEIPVLKLVVNTKVLEKTGEGKDISIFKGTDATANIADMHPVFTGVLPNDEVIFSYSYTLDGNHYATAAELAAALAAKEPGSYKVSVMAALSGADAENYRIAAADASVEHTVTVANKELTLKATPLSVRQNASVDASKLVSLTGLETGDDVTVTYQYQYAGALIDADGINALAKDLTNSPYTITVTPILSGADAAKYAVVPASVDSTLTVTRASSGGGGGGGVSTYAITATAGKGGTITPSGRTSVVSGGTQVYTITANLGYKIQDVKVDGVSVGAVSTYTFEKVRTSHTIEVSFTGGSNYKDCAHDVNCPLYRFKDTNINAWYHDGVHYCLDTGIMNGTGASTFEPETTTTRAMIVTMLARIDGVDTSTGSTWYAAGRDWAVAKGISDGSDIEEAITREQLVTMLYRYAQYKGIKTTAGNAADLMGFNDVSVISSWAKSAMEWAVSAGVITGSDNYYLLPGTNATRAEVATLIMRFCDVLQK